MRSLICAGLVAICGGMVAAQEITRDEIRRAPVPGSDSMEMIVVRLTVPPGATIPLHSHPGDEYAVVVSDTVAETPNGQVVTFDVGQTLYFPEGQVHGGLTNAGESDMVAITTFVVRVGEPLIILAQE